MAIQILSYKTDQAILPKKIFAIYRAFDLSQYIWHPRSLRRTFRYKAINMNRMYTDMCASDGSRARKSVRS